MRGWSKAPFLPRFRGERAQHVQFVHEDDLAEAISGLLVGRHAGAFNVTGDGVMTWQETAEVAGIKVRTMPFGFFVRPQQAARGRRVRGGVASPAWQLPARLSSSRWWP